MDNGCYINVDSRFDAETITRVAEERSGVVQVQGVIGETSAGSGAPQPSAASVSPPLLGHRGP